MTRRRRMLVASLVGMATAASAAPARAQAWVLPAGVGTVGISFQRIDNEGHRISDGSLKANGRSLDESVFIEGEYGLTRRLSVAAGVPYVFAKYVDPDPPPPFLPFFPADTCRCWHSAWQDFGAEIRYNLVDGFDHALALTPSVAVGVPSHTYGYQGEAVAGRDLREVRFGVDAGQRLDVISRRLTVEVHYSYAVVQRVLDIPNNRSNATLDAGVRLSRRVSAHALVSWQRTHGGLRVGSSPADLPPNGDLNTQDRLDQHDRLLRDNYVHAGFEVSYRLARVNLFASYVQFISGTDTHAGRAMTMGAIWRVKR